MLKKNVLLIWVVLTLLGLWYVNENYGCDRCPYRCNSSNTECTQKCAPPPGEVIIDCEGTKRTYTTETVHDCIPDPGSGLTCTKGKDVICYYDEECNKGSVIEDYKCKSLNADCEAAEWYDACYPCVPKNRKDQHVYDWNCS